MQKSNRDVFDRAVATTGAKIIEVEGQAEMEKIFNWYTVMALFFNAEENSSVTREQFIEISKKHKIPTFIDAAGDVPPL